MNEQLPLGDRQLSDLVIASAWPAQFRLEDFDDEIKGSDRKDQLVGPSASEQLIGRGDAPNIGRFGLECCSFS